MLYDVLWVRHARSMDIMLDALSTDGKAVWIYWSWWSNALVYEVAFVIFLYINECLFPEG